MELQGNSEFSRPRPESEEAEERDLFTEPEWREDPPAAPEPELEPEVEIVVIEEFEEEEPEEDECIPMPFDDDDELPAGPIDSEIQEEKQPPRPKAACPIRTNASPGACLAELRERHNYTLQQLAEETKIREDYLSALEADDYRYLPQVVYVMGYIRKLCSLYGVSQEDADSLTADLRKQLQYELPEDISKTVVDHEISEVNERKLRQLLLLITGTVILIVAALVVLGIWLVVDLRSSATSQQSGTPFNENLLIQLQEPPVIRVQELK